MKTLLSAVFLAALFATAVTQSPKPAYALTCFKTGDAAGTSEARKSDHLSGKGTS